jgi:uncharacterized membrane protein
MTATPAEAAGLPLGRREDTSMSETGEDASITGAAFNAAEITALSHLYRGELYRSTVWRTRLDATTNWAVAATGLALSVAFSGRGASPLPLALVGLLVAVFLFIEARRYRFFDFWRIRAHILELNFFGPILRGHGVQTGNGWNETLYGDYAHPALHITLVEAIGRRLRRNYGWIFAIQVVCYAGKLLIHPDPINSIDEIWERAGIGPIPGQFVILAGVAFHSTWIAIALLTWQSRRGTRRHKPSRNTDALLELARGSS